MGQEEPALTGVQALPRGGLRVPMEGGEKGPDVPPARPGGGLLAGPLPSTRASRLLRPVRWSWSRAETRRRKRGAGEWQGQGTLWGTSRIPVPRPAASGCRAHAAAREPRPREAETQA